VRSPHDRAERTEALGDGGFADIGMPPQPRAKLRRHQRRSSAISSRARASTPMVAPTCSGSRTECQAGIGLNPAQSQLSDVGPKRRSVGSKATSRTGWSVTGIESKGMVPLLLHQLFSGG
jgi:hypothetical protein